MPYFMTLSKFIGSKWVSEILILLTEKDAVRFSDVMNALGVTDKVLSGKMGDLQKHGLVNKEVKEDRSTVYSLTEKGRKFAVKLAELNEMLEE